MEIVSELFYIHQDGLVQLLSSQSSDAIDIKLEVQLNISQMMKPYAVILLSHVTRLGVCGGVTSYAHLWKFTANKSLQIVGFFLTLLVFLRSTFTNLRWRHRSRAPFLHSASKCFAEIRFITKNWNCNRIKRGCFTPLTNWIFYCSPDPAIYISIV